MVLKIAPLEDCENVVSMNGQIQIATLDELTLIEPRLIQYAAVNPRYKTSIFKLQIRRIKLNRTMMHEIEKITARTKYIKQNIRSIVRRTLNLLSFITMTETIKVFHLNGINFTGRDYLNGQPSSVTVNNYRGSASEMETYDLISTIIYVAFSIFSVYNIFQDILEYTKKKFKRSL